MSGMIRNLAVNPSPNRTAIKDPWDARGPSSLFLMTQRMRTVRRSVMAAVVLTSPSRISGRKGMKRPGGTPGEHENEDEAADSLNDDYRRGQDGEVPCAGDPIGQVIGIDLEGRVIEVPENGSRGLDVMEDGAGRVGVLPAFESVEDRPVGPDDLGRRLENAQVHDAQDEAAEHDERQDLFPEERRRAGREQQGDHGQSRGQENGIFVMASGGDGLEDQHDERYGHADDQGPQCETLG